MKFAFSFFTVILAVIGVTLFMQYQVYSEQAEASPTAFQYSQEIEIEYRGGSLDIRHHFKNLPNEEIKIDWPAAATNMNCFLEAEYSCDRLADDMRTFKEGETRAQSISYIIPLEGGLQTGRMINAVFASLTKGDVHFTTVHITTDSSIAGQWVTGLPFIGQQQLKLVNYSMFSGTGNVNELYWQQSGLALQSKQPTISVYGPAATTAEFNAELASLPFIHEDHIALVQGTNTTQSMSGRILFVPELTVAALQNNVMLAQIEASYQFGDSPLWLKHFVSTFLTGIQYGDAKTQEMIATVKAQMSEEQLAAWTARLEALKGNPMSVETLDDELSAIFGSYTRYLTMNNQMTELYPFLFGDRRELFVNDVKREDVQVIFKDGQVLYTAQTLLNALGYEAYIGDHGYYVKNETRDFRFPKDHGFYVFNQRRYNTVAQPLTIVAGEYYIEETWLQRLFIVDVKKSEERITIGSTTEQ